MRLKPFYRKKEEQNWNLFDFRSDPDLDRSRSSSGPGFIIPAADQNEADPKHCSMK